MDERRHHRMDRRTFLRRAAGTAVALPTLSAVLAACAKPGGLPPGVKIIPPARQNAPVTLPTYDLTPVATDTPIESGATLQVYNWADYYYKKTLKEFEALFNVNLEYTTFNNMEEGIQKISSNQIQPDVFTTDIDKLNKLVEAKLLQPLNHELIPNLKANIWPIYQNPFYDQGWRYTVPYVIWTTGIGYRRDHISDEEMAAAGYNILWNTKYKGKVGIYDDYREALGMALLRHGITDVNTGDEAKLKLAADDLRLLLDTTDARITINGAYALLPEGDIWAHQAWSGDMVGAQFYLPKGVSTDVLGYWYPPDRAGKVNNDTMTIPANAQHPVLAHAFVNFMLSKKYGFENFADWVGYQPPQTSIKPATLIDAGVVPDKMPNAVVQQVDFDKGYLALELDRNTDQLWFDAWDEVTSGG
ncbi:MAG: extracellular solute-binding protein [Actinomycetota bacterium]